MSWEEWRLSAKRAWQDPFIRWNLVLDGLFVLAAAAFFLWRLIPEGTRSGVLVFHYNIYLGIDDVRPWFWIVSVPSIMAVAFLANNLVAFSLFKRDELAARALSGVTTLLSVVWAVASFFLIVVNL